jgi:hypothetical protein
MQKKRGGKITCTFEGNLMRDLSQRLPERDKSLYSPPPGVV